MEIKKEDYKILQLDKKNYNLIKTYDNLKSLKSFLNLSQDEINYIKLSCNNKINDFLGYKWIWEKDKNKKIEHIPIKLINEKKQLQDIINGKNINIFNVRYYCTLLIKHFYLMGIKDSHDIISECFTWGKKNNVWIKLNIKKLVDNILSNPIEIKDVENVYVTNEELSYIKYICGNKKKSKKLAVGILVYAKVHGVDNVIDLNIRMMCDFIGIDISNSSKSSNFYNRDLKHLFNCNFIEDLEEVNKWKNKLTSFNRKLRVNFKLENKCGEYIVKDDKFIDFYRNINWEKIN